MDSRATPVPGAGHAGFQIPSLDGIRAVSFMVVFIAHAGLDHLVPGGFGVTVFFFLSGYLITTLLRKEFDETGTISFRNFYLRRLLRIFPPMYLTLACAIALSLAGLLTRQIEPAPVLAQLTHMANYYQVFWGTGGTPQGTSVLWSLAVEEHFYLIFPLVCLFLMRRTGGSGRAIAIVAACGAVLAWRIVLVAGGAASERTYLATDTRIDSILWGCALALFRNPMDARTPALRRNVEFGLLATSAGLLLFSLLYRDSAFRETWRYTIQGIALIPIFISAISHPEWPIFRWLGNPLVRYLGTRSYCLYLVHHWMLALVAAQLAFVPGIGRGAIALGLSLLFAEASFRWVERPCAAIRKTLANAPARPEHAEHDPNARTAGPQRANVPATAHEGAGVS